jgi:uncharacterized RDD family membrane protein YckC
MHRFFVLLIVLAFVFGTTSFSGGYVGVSSECRGGQCFVIASTSIASIILGLIFIIFAIKFPREIRNNTENRAGFWRRFGAFILDFIAVLMALTPIVALPTILSEYFYTGSFEWAFQRDYSRSTDILVIFPSVLILLAGLIYYFYKYTLISKPTLGQYVLGYRIVSNNGAMDSSIARKRVLLSVLGMCLWPIAVIHGLIKKRVFWWDSGSNSIARVTSAVNKSSQ